MCTLRKTFEHRKAIYLFQVTPCSPCGSILLRTKLICSKHMRRLVSVRGFYSRWRILCIRNHIQMLSGFPYGRTQHVRHMRSSIVSVIHFFPRGILYVMSCDQGRQLFFRQRQLSLFIAKVKRFRIRITHRSVQQISSVFSIYNSVLVRVQMYCFS